jgi:hypothetical protein
VRGGRSGRKERGNDGGWRMDEISEMKDERVDDGEMIGRWMKRRRVEQKTVRMQCDRVGFRTKEWEETESDSDNRWVVYRRLASVRTGRPAERSNTETSEPRRENRRWWKAMREEKKGRYISV